MTELHEKLSEELTNYINELNETKENASSVAKKGHYIAQIYAARHCLSIVDEWCAFFEKKPEQMQEKWDNLMTLLPKERNLSDIEECLSTEDWKSYLLDQLEKEESDSLTLYRETIHKDESIIITADLSLLFRVDVKTKEPSISFTVVKTQGNTCVDYAERWTIHEAIKYFHEFEKDINIHKKLDDIFALPVEERSLSDIIDCLSTEEGLNYLLDMLHKKDTNNIYLYRSEFRGQHNDYVVVSTYQSHASGINDTNSLRFCAGRIQDGKTIDEVNYRTIGEAIEKMYEYEEVIDKEYEMELD